MNKPRLAAPLALCAALAAALVGLGCSSSSGNGSTAAPGPVSSETGGRSDPAAVVSGDTDASGAGSDPDAAPPVTGSRAGLVAALDDAATSTSAPPAITDDGTDSVSSSLPLPTLDAEVAARLAEFGEWYLGYDHRLAPDARAEALTPLVTPDLLTVVAAPLPAALVAQLAAEERVVTATLDRLEPVEALVGGSVVVRLHYDVTTATVLDGDGGGPTTVESRAVLTVIAGPAGIVEDVR